MTEKLYYKDAYMKDFTAKVVAVSESCGKYLTELDRTAFFPNEGGQYADKGDIDGFKVYDVIENDGVIYHLLEEKLQIGKTVSCRIDFDDRYDKMQNHTGEHIVSGIIHKLFGLDNVGFHLGGEDVTLDINAPLNRDDLARVELLANEVVYENIKVECIFPDKEELKRLVYRSKLDLEDNVRIVNIGEYDSCACCAVHVGYTGEIGLIKILDFAPLRSGIRIHIACGRRAMKYFNKLYSEAHKVSNILSVPKEEIGEGVAKLSEDFQKIKNQYSEYRSKTFLSAARNLKCSGENSVVLLDDATVPEMIGYANAATDKVRGILVVLSPKEDGGYRYVISSESVNLKEKSAEINKGLLGRGGGRANMIQGSFECDIESIRNYFGIGD